MEKHNLMNQESLQEEYEESKIKLIMAIYADLEGKKLIEENISLKQDTFNHPTEKEKRSFIKRVNMYSALHNFKKTTKFVFPAKKNRIAILSLLIVVLLASTFASVEALRIKVFNFFIQVEKEYTEIRLSEDFYQSPGYLHIEWNNAYAPTAIPEGFHIVNVTNGDNIKSIEYENIKEEYIIFQQSDEYSGLNVDTEGADKVLHIPIHDQEGILVRKKAIVTIVWRNDASLFFITANCSDLNEEKVIEIAKSVKLIN